MAGLSNKVETSVLNWVLAQAVLPQIPRIWMSLHSADPGDTGASEVGTGLGYSRVEVTGKFLATSSDKITNILEINFAAATTAYNVAFWGIWGISSAGDETLFYLSGPVSAGSDAITIQVGRSPSFPIGTLTTTID